MANIRTVCIAPYDIVKVKREDDWRHYEVTGVHLGGLGQENLITLASWSQIPGAATKQGEDMIVPEFWLHSLMESGKAQVIKPPILAATS